MNLKICWGFTQWWKYLWTDGQMDRWTDGQMDRWTDGQMDRWTDGQMDRWTKAEIQSVSYKKFFWCYNCFLLVH